jgi:ATP-dependent HslUV protease ATP-binding subunit HslU
MEKALQQEITDLTPQKIVEELDKYIVGQHEAKRSVAIALRNRWRRMQTASDIRKEIIPNNILMIGATGVGKTEIARRLAGLANAPFIKVEASKFTEVGYVGRDVESMVRDLVEQGINLVKAEKKIQVAEKAKENALEQVLDLLVPPLSGNQTRIQEEDFDFQPENSVHESPKPAPGSEEELNLRTRDKFREKLKKGELDNRMVELEVNLPSTSVQIMGPAGMEGMDGLQEMLSGMVPKKKKMRKMTVAEAREYFTEEEAQKLIDMDAVTRDALERTQETGIIFIDEIDKVAGGNSGKSGPDVSREGVQRDLLPIVEGSTVNTKYGAVKTDHVLFIAAGAFHVSKPSDLIPELQGRFPIRVELNSLTEDDFFRILDQPRNALTRQYEEMLRSEGVELNFTEAALRKIATIAFEVNNEVENIGARRLHTILSTVLNEILFDIPDRTELKKFEITDSYVEEKLGTILKKKDLSRYIL